MKFSLGSYIGGAGNFSDIEFYSEKVSVKFTCIFLTKFCLCFGFQKQRKTLYEITKKIFMAKYWEGGIVVK